MTKLKTGRSKRLRDDVMCDYLVAFDHGPGTKGSRLFMTQAELHELVTQGRIALGLLSPQTESRKA